MRQYRFGTEFHKCRGLCTNAEYVQEIVMYTRDFESMSLPNVQEAKKCGDLTWVKFDRFVPKYGEIGHLLSEKDIYIKCIWVELNDVTVDLTPEFLEPQDYPVISTESIMRCEKSHWQIPDNCVSLRIEVCSIILWDATNEEEIQAMRLLFPKGLPVIMVTHFKASFNDKDPIEWWANLN